MMIPRNGQFLTCRFHDHGAAVLVLGYGQIGHKVITLYTKNIYTAEYLSDRLGI